MIAEVSENLAPVQKEGEMIMGLKVVEMAVKSTRQIAEYNERVEALRREEREAEQRGDIRAALAAYNKRNAMILAGPSAS
jgi:hypothetical protein